MEAPPADAEGEDRGDALLPGDADAAGSNAEADHAWAPRWPRRPAATGRQEEKVGTFLVGVTEETTMRLGSVLDRELIHAPTLERATGPCPNISGNYT